MSPTREAARSFVLVHGGLHGGWCWKRVRDRLVAAGHDVMAPTLTGLGERAHLSDPAIGLSAHVEDVVACIECEELDNVVLVGHSYGGMVITGAAARVAERIARLVYIDALVPRDGECVLDLDPNFQCAVHAADGHIHPLPNYHFGLTDPADIAWVHRRLTPQSARTASEPVAAPFNLSVLQRWYVECIDRPGEPPLTAIRASAEKAREDASWHYRLLDAGHDCMISDPAHTADVLLQIAGTPPDRPQRQLRT